MPLGSGPTRRSCPAPELARYDQIYPERTGVRALVTRPAPPGTALAVLAGVLDRDGQQRSATQTRNQALADADHLALLHAIWAAETTPARDQRCRDLLMSILPPADRCEPGHQVKWLWRTLRAAELAGLDAAQVLADAIGERDLAGVRDLAAVIDTRLRYRLGALIPHPVGSWSAQVPEIADPGRRAYLTQIAALTGPVVRPTRGNGFIRDPRRTASRAPIWRKYTNPLSTPSMTAQDQACGVPATSTAP